MKLKIKNTKSFKGVMALFVLLLTSPMAWAGGLEVVSTTENWVMSVMKQASYGAVVIGISIIGYQMLFAERKHVGLVRVAIAAIVIGSVGSIAHLLLGMGGGGL